MVYASSSVKYRELFRVRSIENISKFILMYIFSDFFQVKEERFGNFVCLKMLLIQNVLGVNRKVKWPCHFTSSIKRPDLINHNGSCPGYNPGCYIDGRNGVELGRSVWIGPNVSIISMNHSYPDYENYIAEAPIIIGNRVWIGSGVTILPGVKIGDNVVIGAGSVVTKKSGAEQDGAVLVGNPAKAVKKVEIQ